ncbi:MAG: phenylalanine--tRNA ligase subunit beta [Nitrospirae bacterium]|nr:phenylalanine--tRNA ligase subunit beta [Nitrospirota bacterium]
MRVSLEWIKEFVDVTASPEDVAHQLTMAGLEIEGMEKIGDDVVMEVNVTPNRPDCLNVFGLAREVAALYRLPLKSPRTEMPHDLLPSDIQVTIDDPDLCPRYTGRSIVGAAVSDSPAWLKNRLEKCGIRSINNVVDITNYVLLELGHPLHAFDAGKLSGREIRVARAGKDRVMTTLDTIERIIPEETLLIWDAASPVAVAGIMGGEGSSVTDDTTDIFLESAYFAPASIRRSSKALGLRSESSYRFERGTDRVFLETALNRAALLIAELAGGRICAMVDKYPVVYVPVQITVSYRKINALIGISIGKEEVLALLNAIGIKTEDRGEELVAWPPPFRADISAPVDIIEEVVRCYGYDRIPARPPRATVSDGVLNAAERTLFAVRESIRKNGFTEVVNFSFMNRADLDILSIELHEHEQRRKHVTLRNPLRQEECLMRTTLMPAIVNNFIYNLSRGIRDIRLYEISRVFIDWGKPLPSEGLRLAGLFFQDMMPSLWKEAVPVFYQVKGVLEALFEETGLRQYTFVPSREIFLHSGKSADIYAGDQKIGYLGELGPQVIEKLSLKIQKPQVIVFEIDLEQMLLLLEQKIVYHPMPRYPSVERDVALIMDDQIASADIIALFKAYPADIIEHVELFDQYKGKNLPQGTKSLGIRVTYRSKDHTLAEEDVEPVHLALVEHVAGKAGARIRGAD